jgi:hypothetical protein
LPATIHTILQNSIFRLLFFSPIHLMRLYANNPKRKQCRRWEIISRMEKSVNCCPRIKASKRKKLKTRPLTLFPSACVLLFAGISRTFINWKKSNDSTNSTMIRYAAMVKSIFIKWSSINCVAHSRLFIRRAHFFLSLCFTRFASSTIVCIHFSMLCVCKNVMPKCAQKYK